MESVNSAIFNRDCRIFNETKDSVLGESKSVVQYTIDKSLLLLPKEMVLNAYKNLKELASNGDNLIKFYENLYKSPKLDETNNTVTIFDLNEIEAIKPQYLNLYINKCMAILDKAVNGTITSADIAAIGDPKYIKTFKKHLAITILPDYVSDKDLAKLDNKTCINVTSVFITGRILPFLRELPLSVKQLGKLITTTFNTIDTAIINMNDFCGTIEALRKRGKTNITVDLNKLMMLITYSLLDLCKYLMTLLMRKTNTYINNIIEYSDLKTTFENFYSGNEYELGESVIDGGYENSDSNIVTSLIRGDASIQTSIIDRVINKYTVMDAQDRANDLSSYGIEELDGVRQINVEPFPFDKSPYVNVIRIEKTLDSALNELNTLLKDPDTPIQDIKESISVLYEPESRFKDPISRITDINFYNGLHDTDPKDIVYSVMNEMKNAGKAITIIADRMRIIEFKINTLKRVLSLNINDAYPNHERNAEMIDELTEIQNRFHSIVLLIGDGFNKRFKLLENHMSLNMNRDDIVDITTESDDTDYTSIAMESIFNSNELYREYVAEKQYLEFVSEYSKKNVGSVSAYFEADNNQQQKTQAAPQQTQNAQKPQPAQQQNNGGGTDAKPKVVDNSQNNNGNNNTQQQQQNANGNQNGNQNNSNSQKLDKTYTDGICSELSKTIKDLIERLKKAFASTGKKNKELLDAGKEEMINRSYNNIQATDLLPFSNEDMIAHINSMFSAIGGLTPQDVKTMNQDAIETKLLGATGEKEAPGKSLIERLTHIFKFGKNNKNPKPQTIANGELKGKVPEMIDYCQQYYGTFEDQLSKMQQQIDTIMNQLSTKVLSDNTTQDGQAANNIKYISNVVTAAVSSAMNASRDKANAFMVVLTPFIPNSAKNVVNGNNTQPTDNQNNQQGNQTAQQNNTQTQNTQTNTKNTNQPANNQQANTTKNNG